MRNFILVLTCLFIILYVYLGIGKFRAIMNKSDQLKKTANEIPSSASEDSFKKDSKLQDAVIRRLEIIGEVSRNLPKSFKEKNKQINWFELSQFRDLIAHSYYEISLNRVWKTANERIPQIKEGLKNITLV